MRSDVYVTGSFSFELPDDFPGRGGAIGLPDNPTQWAERLKHSINSEECSISLFAGMIADGGQTVMLTFAPSETPRKEGEFAGDNFSIVLSQDSAIKIGKALIALAELNGQ